MKFLAGLFALVLLLVVGGIATKQTALAAVTPEPVVEAFRPNTIRSCDRWYVPRERLLGCIARELRRTLDAKGPDAIAGVERQIKGSLPLRGSCHQAMHVAAQPWVERKVDRGTKLASLARPVLTNECGAGYMHVVIMVGQRRNLLTGDTASGYCASYERRPEQASCAHALGHGFYEGAKHRVDPALKSCSQLDQPLPAECAVGVFHERAKRLGEAGVGAGPERVCRSVAVEFKASCWAKTIKSPPTPDAFADGTGIDGRCAGLQIPSDRDACTTGASAWNVLGRLLTPAKQLDACRSIEPVVARACFKGVDVRQVTGTFIERCNGFDADRAPACWEWFGHALSFQASRPSPELCNTATKSDWRARCVQAARQSRERPLGIF